MNRPALSRKVFPTDLLRIPLGRVEYGVINRNWKGTTFARMRHWGSYQVVLVLKGVGIYRDAEGREFTLKRGDLFVTTPDVPHQYGPPEGKVWTELAFGFRGKLFDLWRQTGLLRLQDTPIPVSPVDYWQKRIEKFLTPTALERSEPVRHLIKLQTLLADLRLGTPHSKVKDDHLAWYHMALSMIESVDLAKPHTVQEIAEACGMGIHTFRRKFAHVHGVGPATHYRNCRCEIARQMLKTKNASIKEIAKQLGYYDAFHFSKMFKQRFRKSPSAFKFKG